MLSSELAVRRPCVCVYATEYVCLCLFLSLCLSLGAGFCPVYL